MRRSFTALLLALALLAAACGDDDGGDDDATTTTEAEDTTTTTAGDDDGGGDAPDEPDEEPTASAPGITAETITIGYTAIDFDGLNDQFGLDLKFGNYDPFIEALVADVNANGGLLGRELVLEFRSFVPVGATTADSACLELTEDTEVFAALGGFVGPGVEDTNMCFADLHDTILVAGVAATDEQQEQVGGLWVTEQMKYDRRVAGFAQIVVDEGLVPAGSKVALMGDSPNREPQVEATRIAMEAAGFEVGVATSIQAVGDDVQASAETRSFIERARSENIDIVVLVGRTEFRDETFLEDAPDFTYLIPDGNQYADWADNPPPTLRPETVVHLGRSADPVAQYNDPDFRSDCLDVVTDAGLTVLDPAEPIPDGERDFMAALANTCLQLQLFIQVMDHAGVNPTNESWIAALDEVDLDLPSQEFSSFGSGKYDANDSLEIVTFDIEGGVFETVVPATDIG